MYWNATLQILYWIVGGVLLCTPDTTDKSIKFTDFDDTSTDPVCMPLVYWSTQTTATINILRPEQSTNTVYLPYVSTANAAATIIQHAYTKHVNHLRLYHHQQITTNVKIENIPPTQLEVIPASLTDIMQDYINTRYITLHRQLDDNRFFLFYFMETVFLTKISSFSLPFSFFCTIG
jgi:hypothetical protein